MSLLVPVCGAQLHGILVVLMIILIRKNRTFIVLE